MDIRQAGCKVNLSLKIVGVRADGYHLLDSLFWPLRDPFDILEFHPRPNQEYLSMSCNIADIDCQNNTLTKAYAAFINAGGKCMGVHVHLQKNIPHGAGLGGGSSDAACVLTWCNDNAKNTLSPHKLAHAALQVGADVPFFLKNIPARVQGIGECIESVENLFKDKYILVISPPIHIDTKWAYRAWDEQQKNIFSSQDLTKRAHKDKHSFSYASKDVYEFVNDFEDVVFEQYPELAQIKHTLLSAKAEIAIMSGSGSSMVGIFKSKTHAKKAAKMYENYRVFITTL